MQSPEKESLTLAPAFGVAALRHHELTIRVAITKDIQIHTYH